MNLSYTAVWKNVFEMERENLDTEYAKKLADDAAAHTGHTLGPWKKEGRVPCWAIVSAAGHDIFYIDKTADHYESRYSSDAELAANARLIAAAPELLEACRAIVALADGQGRMNMLEVAGMARQATARAETERCDEYE